MERQRPQRHLLLPIAGRRCFDKLSTGIRGNEEDDLAALMPIDEMPTAIQPVFAWRL